MDIGQYFEDTRTLAITYLIASFVIPWGVGRTTLETFNATFIHSHWWVFEIYYALGESPELYTIGDSVMYINGTTIPVEMIAWHVGAVTLAVGVLAAVYIDINPGTYTIPITFEQLLTATLTLAGICFIITSAWITLFIPTTITLPFGAIIMLIGAAHIHRNTATQHDISQPRELSRSDT